MNPHLHPVPLTARLLWLGPLFLFVIAVWLVVAGREQRAAAERGTVVQAVIDTVDVRERSEITRGDVRLRYTPPGAAAAAVILQDYLDASSHRRAD